MVSLGVALVSSVDQVTLFGVSRLAIRIRFDAFAVEQFFSRTIFPMVIHSSLFVFARAFH